MKKQKNLNNHEIASFCSQVAMLQQAGIAPAEGMSILLSDVHSADGRAVYQAIYDVCSQGESFYTGMKSCDLFPEYVLHMVKIGEESGSIDTVMTSLAAYYEREEEIADNIKSAVSYPCIMIAMMFVVIVVLITKVLPIFNQVFQQLGTEMNGFSASLMVLGSQINRYSIVLLCILGLLVVLYLLATKTIKGKNISSRFMSSLPFMKNFYMKVASGRFASGMALTLSSGLDTYHSLDMVKDLVNNADMEAKINQCKQELETGANFSEALAHSEIFSNFYARMIAVGVRTGSIDTVLNQIADECDKETSKTLQRIISILEPTLVIILSLIVGLILLSVILPLMGIMSSIG